ncbi:major facilitator transporter [Paraburkholderia caffeinilytica]|uniref:MFS transporter n=1 Tax=Paraburkholderia caffeinilytica TaxID=1761016 RepID=A0ABQ1LEM0_9BURK|nr:MFS transporter [Paraburkholderia caffeinilytica]AXL51261.1 major facilitator transporter [Paraburkholderia caffeinilytica]GGC23258.1 MFS transporter [Paraburkholderia caffeinilytica]CAB3777160.1 Fosfomycin resistance protein AbaF [Paraburkholderia caffeinilytica]
MSANLEATTDDIARESRSSSTRAAFSSFIGTTVEWYDYFLYGTAAALVFPKVFFSQLTPEFATLASMASFAVAFVLRPLGGMVIGHFGDRVGRKKMLIFTLLVMGLCTAAIGFLPSYAIAGYWAPGLLILLRIVQGFALGGEWGGAALMSVEHAPAGRRGLFGATMQMGVPAGLLVSTGAFALVSSLPDAQFFTWGWRLPFVFSLALLAVGMYIRLQVSEPPNFEKVKASGNVARIPLLEVWQNEKLKTLIMVFFQTVANVGYFLITVYALTYITSTLHLPRSVASSGLLVAAAVDLAMQPVFGWLSDQVGRKVVYGFGAVFFAAYAFPFFWLLDTGNPLLITVALALGLGIGHASTGSLHGVIYAEQYPTRYRFSGASTAYQLSGIISSAPTPLVAAWLVARSGNSMSVSWYVVAAAVISFVCVLLVKETFHEPIDR